jgi:hypothetical protein
VRGSRSRSNSKNGRPRGQHRGRGRSLVIGIGIIGTIGSIGNIGTAGSEGRDGCGSRCGGGILPLGATARPRTGAATVTAAATGAPATVLPLPRGD